MTLEIRKGTPIPRRYSISKYPLKDMEIGDMFLVPDESLDVANRRYAQSAVSSAAGYWQRTTGRKFITRRIEGGIGVWRVK